MTASLAEPLGALVDPVDGVGRAVAGRRFVLPLLLLAAAAATSGAAFAWRWNAAPVVISQIESSGEMTSTTDQELLEKIETAERLALVTGLAKGIVLMPLAVLAVAAVLKLLGWLIRRSAPFSGCFSAAAIAFLPIALYHLLFAALAARMPELGQSQLATLVPSDLGHLVHAASPKLGRVLGAVDFFNLWSAALLGLGFASAGRFPRWKGLAWGILLYAAFAAVFLIAAPGLTPPGGPK